MIHTEGVIEKTQKASEDLTDASGIFTGVFGFSERTLLPHNTESFCDNCPLSAAGQCDPNVAHRYGCYEAERWSGQYIYYCPTSLVFIATLVREQDVPVCGLVMGPIVMGTLEDQVYELGPEMRLAVTELPCRTSAEVNALARLPESLALAFVIPMVLPTDSHLQESEILSPTASPPNYPLESEQRLVSMIRHGDRVGAAELINTLLGTLYLSCDRDFFSLKRGAGELITVFSRAAIEGGADARSIFGEKQILERRFAGLKTTHDLSAFLAMAFDRFVSYVFDFSQFRHSNTLHQIVDYVRTHYAERITLTDVARHVWLSPSYLSSVFSEEMGMSFTAYVQTVRIGKSKELLQATHMSVADIASETGFTDQSYFTKVFARSTGVSPTQFRRQQHTSVHV